MTAAPLMLVPPAPLRRRGPQFPPITKATFLVTAAIIPEDFFQPIAGFRLCRLMDRRAWVLAIEREPPKDYSFARQYLADLEGA